jgi:hypothetical protein
MLVPLRCGCRLGLAAVVRPGSSILAQRRSLTSRVGGCRSRPAMMLARNSTLSIIKTEISWKPENLRVYADCSHGEKLCLLIDHQKDTNAAFLGLHLGRSGALLYTRFLLLAWSSHFAAQNCRAIILRDLTPAEPTQRETAQCMKAPSVAHLYPLLILLFLNNPQTGYNFRLCAQACEVRRF